MNALEWLKNRMSPEEYSKLARIPNPAVHDFVAESAKLCNPDQIFVCTDSEDDIAFVCRKVVVAREERPLKIPGHTYHFDGPADQGRDRKITKYLVPKGDFLSKALNQVEREEGLTEIKGLLQDSMKGKTMIVLFLCLGPKNSVFTIPCMECTDSWYVAHSVNLLYRRAYDLFAGGKVTTPDLFRVLHSAGKLDERMTSAEPSKKRVYIDYTQNVVYSVNTQYAGNSVGFKKLALRLAIRKAHREGWLAEHMMLTGVRGPGGRKSYFAGAFPSACGKTSTAMISGNTILGDDIAYLRNVDGVCRAVNVEAGIFGILRGVNRHDDPMIWEILHTPGEVLSLIHI